MIRRLDQVWENQISAKASANISRGGVIIATICGSLGVLGWTLNVPFLANLDHSASMKPVVAISMLALAGAVVAIWKQWLTVAATCTMGVMSLMLVTVQAAMNSPIGLEERPQNPGLSPGLPSVGSVAALTLCAIGLFVWLIGNGPLRPLRRGCALISICIGASALFGHFIGTEMMYWSLPRVSTGMAIHTAIGMIALGCSIHEITMRRDKIVLT